MILHSLLFVLGALISLPLTAAQKEETIRVASFNVTADFFDRKESEYKNHNWPQRRHAVLETIKQIGPDVLGVQELSPTQAVELSELPGYHSLFLSQTPSDIEPGVIIAGKEVKGWLGKNTGTPLVGVFYKGDKLNLEDKGRFWFKEDPDSLPVHKDRKETDKGFGNMNTYRGPIWVKLKHLNTNQFIYFFNSHYPLSGNHNTRFNCARVEREKIDAIAKNEFWISMGDRNIIPEGELTESDMAALEPLLKGAHNAVGANNHLGPLTTFAGFNYDDYKNPITKEGAFQNSKVLDVIVSNSPSISSQHIVTQFDASGGIQVNPKILNNERNFASDHLMVVADYVLKVAS